MADEQAPGLPARRSRSKASPALQPSCLFPSEQEIGRLVLGSAAHLWPGLAVVLERSGLPKRDPQFADRRFWPAVLAFLDRQQGFDPGRSSEGGIVERFRRS